MQRITVGALSVVFAAIAVFLATYKGDYTSSTGTCPLGYTSKSSRGVTLFYDATFFTAREEDQDGVTRGAMAIDNASGRIVAMYGKEEVEEGVSDIVTNLQACRMGVVTLRALGEEAKAEVMVAPGFVDNHIHMISGGRRLSQVNLASASSKEQFIDIVRDYWMKQKQQQQQEGESSSWVLGCRWHDAIIGAFPDKTWLDEATGADVPVWLSRADGHSGVASSKVLSILGITKDNVAEVNARIDGGFFDIGDDGEPTGVVRENAMGLLKEVIMKALSAEDMEKRRAWRDAAVANLHAFGITAVHDMGDGVSNEESTELIWNDAIKLYAEEPTRDGFFVRVAAAVPLTLADRLASHIAVHGRGNEKFRIGSVKAFADGSLGSRTALFHSPYQANGVVLDPPQHGLRMMPLEKLTAAVLAASELGLQIIIHAIGDAAIDEVLEIYTRVKGGTESVGTFGHRIEHVQHVTTPPAETAARFASVNATAGMQPLQLLYDREVAEDVLGKEKAGASSYIFALLRDAGVRLAFGSDWPVVDADPMQALFAAVHRRAPTKSEAWIPSQVLDVATSWRAHTIHAAKSMLWDDDIGSLATGKLADFVIVPADAMDVLRYGTLSRVLSTYVGGVCVYGC